MRKCRILFVLLLVPMLGFAQFDDDIYFSPKKNKNTTTANEQNANELLNQINEKQSATVTTTSIRASERDVDEYNRRGNSFNSQSAMEDVDVPTSSLAASIIASSVNEAEDFEFTRQMARFNGSNVYVTNANVIVDQVTGDIYVDGFANNSFNTWNNSLIWGPTWNMSFGWNSWGWNSWGWGWNSWAWGHPAFWGPSWGWGWNRPCWNSCNSWAWSSPHWTPHRNPRTVNNNTRPANNVRPTNSANRPANNTVRPSTSTRSSANVNTRPSNDTRPTNSMRPTEATRPANNVRPAETTRQSNTETARPNSSSTRSSSSSGSSYNNSGSSSRSSSGSSYSAPSSSRGSSGGGSYSGGGGGSSRPSSGGGGGRR